MDVSFSAWRHSREESLQLKGDNFSFLFDRRYTNRLNRMSRVFFEAYVVATKELAAQEDRFPSLSEIDAKMESGAVYAFKDRLMKNTEFFEEVKISGVSYLVPRALRFVDVTGTYTDLILNLDEGAVVMPTRRKTPEPPVAETPSPEIAVVPDILKPEPVVSEQSPMKEEPATPKAAKAMPENYPPHTPEPFSEIDSLVREAAAAMPAPEPAPEKEEALTSQKRPPETPVSKKKKDLSIPPVSIALAAAAVILVAGAVIFFSGTMNQGVPILVEYSAYLSNSSNESYLGLDISNPKGMINDMEMVLPKEIDQSISARGGTVTISHANNTLVRLNSSSDASVRIYLEGNWTTVPVGLNFAAPAGFDTSIVVHGKDYFVTHKNDTLVLMFNLTKEGVSFEQSYSEKR
ncbi:MAG: hypothetical protein GYA29_06495 [Methanothrix sp.]|nr:hypothetical protein [Methanothrix sp.]